MSAIRDENHLAWWDLPLSVILIALVVPAIVFVVALFICVVIPIGAIGASWSWLMKAGR